VREDWRGVRPAPAPGDPGPAAARRCSAEPIVAGGGGHERDPQHGLSHPHQLALRGRRILVSRDE